jgi:hypothetical protein
MTPATFSCSRASKSRRGRPLGSKALAIRSAVFELTGRFPRMTVRQVFYALEVQGVVEKTEGGYRQVQAQVLRMRREGLLPWSFITDGTRWQRKPNSYVGVEDFMAQMARTYRRDLWQAQGVRLEVWLEKDALADLIVDTTAKWDVPLMVSRGQSSATFLYSAAKVAEQAWVEEGVQTFVFMLYDRDGGGRRAARTIARELPEHAPSVPIEFELLAVTDEQIAEWDLPTRPAKASDPEAAKFTGPAVELDAIPPDKLVELVENAIVNKIDLRAWQVQQVVEAEERLGLLRLAGEAVSYDPLKVFTDALEARGCSWRGHPWKGVAQCPAHEDRSPSLSFAEGVDGRVVLYCFAGCEAEDVVRALGLAWADLFPNGHRHAPKSRQPKVKTERPVISVLVALYALGIDYRLTTSSRMFVADWCPLCAHRALWIHDYREYVRLSCWTSGCESDDILAAIERRVTGEVDRVAA